MFLVNQSGKCTVCYTGIEQYLRIILKFRLFTISSQFKKHFQSFLYKWQLQMVCANDLIETTVI